MLGFLILLSASLYNFQAINLISAVDDEETMPTASRSLTKTPTEEEIKEIFEKESKSLRTSSARSILPSSGENTKIFKLN